MVKWKGTWDKPSVRESFVVVGPMPNYLRPVFEHLTKQQSEPEAETGSRNPEADADCGNEHDDEHDEDQS